VTYQTLPRILIQEAHSNIESSTTPALNAVCIGQSVASLLCNVDHINGTEASGEKRLVGITPSCVHDEGTRVFTNGFSKSFGALLDDDVSPSDLARETGIERRTSWVLAVLESRYDELGPDAWLALENKVNQKFAEGL